MEDIKIINRLLAERFGKLYDGRPIFRVVWSEDEFENRFGKYSVYAGHVFMRQEVGMMRVKKYRNIAQERFVFERLITIAKLPQEIVQENPEAVKGSYEPLHVFKFPPDAIDNGVYVKPSWNACESLAYFALYGRVKSASERKDDQLLAEKKEYDQDIDRIKDAGSAMDAALFAGSAVTNALDTPGPNLRKRES